MTIGVVAERAGVAVETIRYYERQGLIDRPPKSSSGYRQFSEQDLRRFRFIRQAKALGFSLREVRELLGLRVEPGRTCEDVRAAALAKLAEIKAKIMDLTRMQSALEELAKSCVGSGPVSACPILEAMEGSPKATPAAGRTTVGLEG